MSRFNENRGQLEKKCASILDASVTMVVHEANAINLQATWVAWWLGSPSNGMIGDDALVLGWLV